MSCRCQILIRMSQFPGGGFAPGNRNINRQFPAFRDDWCIPPARPPEVPNHPVGIASLMPTAASSRRSRWRLRARFGPMLPTGISSLADASA